MPEAVRLAGYFDQKWHVPYPSFVFSREHYGRIMRLLERGRRMAMCRPGPARSGSAQTPRSDEAGRCWRCPLGSVGL